MAPKTDFSLRQIDFVLLSPRQVLVVLVGVHGQVENRVIETQQPLSPAQLQMAANYLNHQATGKKLSEVQALVAQDMAMQRAQLDALTQKVVQSGLAVWSEFGGGQLIVKGHAQLLKDVQAVEDIERIRQLFDALEVKENLWRLVGDAESAEGVKIFIGTEHPVFQQSGCSLVVAPFGRHSSGHMVGAIGVIGPTRLNYARIIPLVDFTAKLMDKVLGQDP
ncbi:MAG: heat-inducible transcriptional repressor HrcA [Alphaproteobacteria bacterium]|nr:heat-inducible transcriptional repressor HrcA [Alphaproteobacteria bacterium]